ncbi:MAG TPA: 16S rRNA (cytosine(967)-C(5))-methyltransferase RsmB [Rhodocyclaceae bacterium]
MERSSDATLAAALLLAARQIAVVIEGASLQGHEIAAVAENQRGQVHDLVYGSLRRYGWGDFLIGRLMPRPPEDTLLRGLLLAALYRLETRPDIAHVVVHQAVEAASRFARGRYTRLVNAVLRNAKRREDELRTALAADPVASNWHPAWWLAELKASYPERWSDIVAAGNEIPPMTLRVNRRRAGADEVVHRFAAEGIALDRVGTLGLLLPRPMAVERLPAYADGLWSVQDAGAQRAAELLAPRDGERVLDACAAPGGKTAHLAELADLELLALDNDAIRSRRINENLVRLGLRATIKVGDAGLPARWWDGKPFDRILLDAPCTASGVVRRHPDAKWLRRAEDLAGFAAQQQRLLRALWPLLASGGKLLYATCSVFPRENGEQVSRFLAEQGGARDVTPGGAADRDPGLQLLPCPEHDGFFYALLEKHG